MRAGGFFALFDAEENGRVGLLAEAWRNFCSSPIFGAGLGVPFLSTDTAGAVRAAEIEADAMLMAKNIDYIYTADPRVDKNAKKLESVKASEVLALNLKAIDATATAFCLSCGMPIRVFGFKDPRDILNAVRGNTLGTIVIPE